MRSLKLTFLLAIATITLCSNFVPNEIIIKLKNSTDFSTKKALQLKSINPNNSVSIPNFNFKIEKVTSFKNKSLFAKQTKTTQTGFIDNIFLLKLATKNIQEAIKDLSANPNVEYAHPNYIYSAYDTVPNDTLYVSNQKSIMDVYEMEKAWDISTGAASVIVAVIDSGVNYNHPDLIGKVILGYDYVNSDNDPNDDHSHGTHVAGIIAANSNNNTGITGMAWKVKIYAQKVLDSSGTGSVFNIAQAIIDAVDYGAKVINCSIGGPYTSLMQSGIDYAYSKNAIVVAAAGNDDQDLEITPNSPVCNDGANNAVIGVASVGTTLGKSSFSNYSTNYVDISAIGEVVRSTVLGSSYQDKNGTSMATPMVSGLVALLLSIDTSLTIADIHYLLDQSATDVDPYNSSYIGKLGSGCINAYQSLYLLTYTPTTNTQALLITKFYNYPNPVANAETFSSNTTFYILANKVPDNLKLEIYSYSGVKVKTIEKTSLIPGIINGTGTKIAWNLKDDNGYILPPGPYIAVVNLNSSNGSAQKVHKVIIK